MEINGITVKGNKIAYDGCHKIYILEDKKDEKDALEYEYEIYPIKDLQNIWDCSCDLRFINNWKLNVSYVEQFEEAKITF